jgi:hypothetical protein
VNVPRLSLRPEVQRLMRLRLNELFKGSGWRVLDTSAIEDSGEV